MSKGRRPRTLGGQPLGAYVCTHCKGLNCNKCVDILRVTFNMGSICKCSSINHSGEPANKQIMDPTTETVHAPGLTVDKDGEVKRD